MLKATLPFRVGIGGSGVLQYWFGPVRPGSSSRVLDEHGFGGVDRGARQELRGDRVAGVARQVGVDERRVGQLDHDDRQERHGEERREEGEPRLERSVGAVGARRSRATPERQRDRDVEGNRRGLPSSSASSISTARGRLSRVPLSSLCQVSTHLGLSAGRTRTRMPRRPSSTTACAGGVPAAASEGTCSLMSRPPRSPRRGGSSL
jgi:hypothetical protein